MNLSMFSSHESSWKTAPVVHGQAAKLTHGATVADNVEKFEPYLAICWREIFVLNQDAFDVPKWYQTRHFGQTICFEQRNSGCFSLSIATTALHQCSQMYSVRLVRQHLKVLGHSPRLSSQSKLDLTAERSERTKARLTLIPPWPA